MTTSQSYPPFSQCEQVGLSTYQRQKGEETGGTFGTSSSRPSMQIISDSNQKMVLAATTATIGLGLLLRRLGLRTCQRHGVVGILGQKSEKVIGGEHVQPVFS